MKMLFALSLILSSSAFAASIVAVKPAVELDAQKTEIMLSDLVAAKGLSRAALEKFRSIKLSDAPAAGESRIFSKETIASSIQDDLEAVEKATGESFEIKIPSRVTVSKTKPSLSIAALRQQMTAKFKSLCADCEFEFTNMTAPTTVALPKDSTWALRVRSELPKGSFSYPIEVTVGENVVQTYWASGQIQIRRPVPVAAREIAFGERIQETDLVTQVKDVTYATDAVIATSDLTTGVAARQISIGQVVYRSSLRRELAVKSGDIVKVTSGTPDWEITLDGIAQDSGYIGDAIKVKIPKSGKLISGSLREKGIVQVQ